MTLKNLYKKSKKYSDEPIDLNFEIEVFLENKDKKNTVERQQVSPFFHPSQISKGIECERWWYYYLSGEPGEVTVDANNASSILKMNIGTGIHDMMHRLFYNMGILEGVWKCNACGEKFWATSPKNSNCSNCKTFFSDYSKLTFKEVPLHGEIIRGHADGLINRGGKRLLLEIKSIKNLEEGYSNYGFENLIRPIDEHVLQAMLYLHEWNNKVKESQEHYNLKITENGTLAIGQDNSPISLGTRTIGKIDKAILFYIAKNTAERKIFIVKYDYNQIRHLVSKTKKIYTDFLQENLDGTERLCNTIEDFQKKRCRYKAICKPMEGKC